MKKQKNLLVYIDSGGGHRRGARIIEEELNKFNNQITIRENILKEYNGNLKIFYEEGYTKLIEKHYWLYKILYSMGRFRWFNIFAANMIDKSFDESLEKLITKHDPDRIIATFQGGLNIKRVLDKINKSIPVHIVVTDNYTPPNLWFLSPDVQYYTMSQSAAKVAIKNKTHFKNINNFKGLFVSNKFVNKKLDQKFIKDINLEHKKTVLITGGGIGNRQSIDIARKVISNDIKINLIILTGNNEEQYKKLTNEFESYDNIIPIAYTDHVQELISISDLVICKGGPATIHENLIMNKPMIINQYIWGQEKGNVEFITSNNLGIYTESISEITNHLNNLESKQIKDLENNCKKYPKDLIADKIAKQIINN